MRLALRFLAPALVVAACLLSPSAGQAAARDHSPIKCSACHHLVAVVQNHLGHPQHPSEQSVVHAVEHACSWFPDNHKRICHEVVHDYGGALIDHILRDTHPYRHICQEVGVCADRALAADRCRAAQPTPLS